MTFRGGKWGLFHLDWEKNRISRLYVTSPDFFSWVSGFTLSGVGRSDTVIIIITTTATTTTILGYGKRQLNCIMDAFGRWSKDLETTIQSLFGTRSKEVLCRMQKALPSATLDIARTFKIVT